MFASLRSRLALTYLLVIGIVLGMALFVLFVVVRNIPLRNAGVRLQELTRLIAPAIDFTGAPLPRQAEALGLLAEQFEIRILIVGRMGSVLYDSGAGIQPVFNRIPLMGMQGSGPGRGPGPGPAENLRDADGGWWLYAVRTLEDGNHLVLAAPRPGFQWLPAFGDALLPPLLWASGFAVLLAVLVAGLTARSVSGPLGRMAAAARRIPAGEYTPIAEDGPEEVRDLARAFNEMVVQVRSGQQSQRDFVANVSHELKTPLTAIQGFSQAISDGTARSPEEVDRAARVIREEAGRMQDLVTGLLELARLEGGGEEPVREPVDLAALLASAIEKLSPQIEAAGVRAALSTDANPPVSGDPDRLFRVFANLLENAIRAAPAGSEVAVRLAADPGWAVVSVADTGPGIPPGEDERIFERFYQLDKSRARGGGQGFGLGLAIAREIVEGHGGVIEVESEVGRGSVFTVKIPSPP
ncbi:MAG TPA: HAMP domain-containing sensor histidine kinase [Anaerolineales bacterium]|nr:HAMP domain-containing sensor histidine kinase [Anaerolineales bacterium]